MPIDPVTGERLPYPGEPGAPPAPEGEAQVPEGGLVPSRDLKPLMDEADRIMAEGPGAEGEEAPTEEMPPEGAPAEEAPAEMLTADGVDVSAIAEALDVDADQAIRLYEAAQQIPMLAGQPAEDLAQMMKDDFQLRMRVEGMAAEGEDQAQAADAMTAPAEPPAGPPMGGIV